MLRVKVSSVTGVQFMFLCPRAKLGQMLTKYSFMCFAVSSGGMSSPLVRVSFAASFFFGMSVSMVLLFLCSSCLTKSALVYSIGKSIDR